MIDTFFFNFTHDFHIIKNNLKLTKLPQNRNNQILGHVNPSKGHRSCLFGTLSPFENNV